MRRRYGLGDEASTVHINVVPLIDVMFFLVLFFVATASFVQDAAVDVNRPAARTGTVQERGNIVVAVTRAGEVFVMPAGCTHRETVGADGVAYVAGTRPM